MFFSNKYFEELKRIALEYCHINYNYCYLSAMHEKNDWRVPRRLLLAHLMERAESHNDFMRYLATRQENEVIL